MKSTSYKIKLLGSINGAAATIKKIAWIQGDDSCLATPCYKENDYIVIEFIPDCIGSSCVEGWILFGDDCANCEPLYFKRCFCSADTECADCEVCNEYGFCQSLCKINQICDNDKCVECNDGKPCINGKICIDGQCKCPQGTFEKDGRCVECDSTTILNKCQECINGKIVPKKCDGACDPATGICVDCVISGDCKDRTDGKTCCDDKKCVCCPGSVYDAVKQKCVPQTCTDDSQCPVCQKCTADGCKPIECPAGFRCVNGVCVEWGCKETFCTNGGDCGKGCGCIENKCVPCELLPCYGTFTDINGTVYVVGPLDPRRGVPYPWEGPHAIPGVFSPTCSKALGCECSGNGVCTGVGNCNESCDGYDPCLQEGCTCYETDCVACENFSCESTECSYRKGCTCIGGKCKADPNPGGGGGGCQDTFSVFKNCGPGKDDCKVIAALNSKGCDCDPITFKVKVPSICNGTGTIPSSLKFDVEAFKGDRPFKNYTTDDKFADNELLSGQLELKYEIYNKEGDTTPTSGATSSAIPDKNKYNLNAVSTTGMAGKYVKVKIKLNKTEIPNNRCTSYESDEIEYILDFTSPAMISKTCSDLAKEHTVILTDKSSRKSPTFVWSKTTNGVVGAPFKKDYPPYVNGAYTDSIKNPSEGLCPGESYEVKTDCAGCASPVGTLPSVDFCCAFDTVNPVFGACNATVTIPKFEMCKGALGTPSGTTSSREVLDPNATLAKTCANGADVQVKITTEDGSSLFPMLVTANGVDDQSFGKEGGKPITAIEMYINYGGVKKCVKNFVLPTLPEINPVPVVDCSPVIFGEVNYGKAKITFPASNPAIQSVIIDGKANTLTNGSITIDRPLGGTIVKATVVYVGGCKKDIDLKTGGATETCPIITNPPSDSQHPEVVSTCENLEASIRTTVYGFDLNKPIVSYLYKLPNLTTPVHTKNHPPAGAQYIGPSNAPYYVVMPYVGSGEYVIRSVQGAKVETSYHTVVNGKQPIVTFDPPNKTYCGASKGVKMSISFPPLPQPIVPPVLVTFKLTKPGGDTETIEVYDDGSGIVTEVFDLAKGNYNLELNNLGVGYCFDPLQFLSSQGNKTLNPKIVLEKTSTCEGGTIGYRVESEEVGYPFNVIVTNATTTTPTVVSSNSGFNGVFTPEPNEQVTLTIISAIEGCTTINGTSILSNIQSFPLPIIEDITQSCDEDTGLKTINIATLDSNTVQISLDGSNFVGSVQTLTGANNLFTKDDIPSNVTSIRIKVTKGTCFINSTYSMSGCGTLVLAPQLDINANECGSTTSQQISLSSEYIDDLKDYTYIVYRKLENAPDNTWVSVDTGMVTSQGFTTNVEGKTAFPQHQYKVAFKYLPSSTPIYSNIVTTSYNPYPILTLDAVTTPVTGTAQGATLAFKASATPTGGTFVYTLGNLSSGNQFSNYTFRPSVAESGFYTATVCYTLNGCVTCEDFPPVEVNAAPACTTSPDSCVASGGRCCAGECKPYVNPAVTVTKTNSTSNDCKACITTEREVLDNCVYVVETVTVCDNASLCTGCEICDNSQTCVPTPAQCGDPGVPECGINLGDGCGGYFDCPCGPGQTCLGNSTCANNCDTGGDPCLVCSGITGNPVNISNGTFLGYNCLKCVNGVAVSNCTANETCCSNQCRANTISEFRTLPNGCLLEYQVKTSTLVNCNYVPGPWVTQSTTANCNANCETCVQDGISYSCQNINNQVNCNGSCVELGTNANCSGCGQPCGAGLTCCGRVCKNLSNDVSNCNGCGAQCPEGYICKDRNCITPSEGFCGVGTPFPEPCLVTQGNVVTNLVCRPLNAVCCGLINGNGAWAYTQEGCINGCIFGNNNCGNNCCNLSIESCDGNGNCIPLPPPPPCGGLICQPNSTLNPNTCNCVPNDPNICLPPCNAGFHCENYQCVPDYIPCNGTCTQNQTCTSVEGLGEICVDNPTCESGTYLCGNVCCNNAQGCSYGSCFNITDPCTGVICPNGGVCLNGFCSGGEESF